MSRLNGLSAQLRGISSAGSRDYVDFGDQSGTFASLGGGVAAPCT